MSLYLRCLRALPLHCLGQLLHTSSKRDSGTDTRVGMPPPRSNNLIKSSPDSKSAAMASDPESRTTDHGRALLAQQQQLGLVVGCVWSGPLHTPHSLRPRSARQSCGPAPAVEIDEARRTLDLLPIMRILGPRHQVLESRGI